MSDVSRAAIFANATPSNLRTSTGGATPSFNPLNVSSISDAADSLSTDSIDLSERAKRIIAQANDSQNVIADFQLSAQERFAKRVDAFAQKLSALFDKLSIPLSEKTVLNIDAYGEVKIDGAYKKKLEQYFKDNPEEAKELKTIAKLSALQATQKALDLYYQEKKAAKGDAKLEKAADERYGLRAAQIKELSGTLIFEDGKLHSAAIDYIDAIINKQTSASI